MKPFNKLPKAKQRVAIAKDVLLQLSKKRFKPTTGLYVDLTSREYIDSYLEANKVIKKGLAKCQVCAKGAMFMSHVMKTNNCSVFDADNTEEYQIKDRLKMFDAGQLDLIECAFEKRVIEDHEGILKHNLFTITPLAESAIAFGKKYPKAKRIQAIMRNIIKNKGTFKP